MKVLVPIDQRFSRTPDGELWTDGQFPYAFWLRYLEVFDEVRVVGRVRDVQTADDAWLRTDGPGVFVDETPYYLGMRKYLMRAWQVQRAVRKAIQREAAVIMRIGQIASVMHPMLVKSGHPFGLEVVGDPYDVFSPHAVQHPLRPLLRWQFTRRQQRQCRQAAAVAYVTREYLQSRYPTSPEGLSSYYSDVELSSEAFAATPRSLKQQESTTIITVGSLAQRYKGIDVLIDAVDKALSQGADVNLKIVGDGQYRKELETQAASRGRLDSQIRFLGQVPGSAAVRSELQQADLFVLPSKVEGLPRALLEAMAIALPCIASDVGGIPELLELKDLVPPGDADALSERICHVVAHPLRMRAMSERNLSVARDYSETALQERRRDFYRHIREVTERWLSGS